MEVVIVLLSLFALCHGSPVQNTTILDPETIVNGEKATSMKYPWHAILRYNGNPGCGGTIISKNAILTAAHCVQGARGLSVTVGVTELRDTRNAQNFRVSKVIPYRQSATFPHDIAVIILDGTVTKNKYVKIVNSWATTQYEENKAFTSDDDCWNVGFGAYQRYPPYSGTDHLRQLNVQLTSAEDCSKLTLQQFGRYVPANLFCYINRSKSACYGDSGSSVGCFKNGQKGKYKLVGLVQGGYANNCLQTPSLYVRVAYYRDWIKGILKANKP